MQQFQCSSCGAGLDDPGTGTTMRCPYCNSSIIIPPQLIAAREATASAPTTPSWAVGQKVFAYWSADEYYYPATIAKVESGNVYVRFDDAQESWLSSDALAVYQLSVGDSIECKWSGNDAYYSAQVLKVKGEQIEVGFEDGVQEWTSLSNVRLWFEE